MADSSIINYEVPEGDLEVILDYIRDMGINVNAAASVALPKIGHEVLVRIRRDGPRSAKHRGPAKRPHTKKPRKNSDRWRSEVVHAIDTIKVSPIRRDQITGTPYVMVGPGRGDNSPSFYLKFFEYGTVGDDYTGKPFIRPARREVMQNVAPQILTSEINRQLRGGKKGK